MQKNKVELLTLDFPPVEGGISRYLYEIVRHIPPDEVRVTAVAAPGSKDFDVKQEFAIDRLKVPSNWDAFQKQLKFFAPFYFKALLQKSDISFLLCGQAHYSLMVPAWAMSKIKRIPFGIFSHGLDLLYPQTTRYKKAFNHILKAADIVFANSAEAERILLQLNVLPEKIQIIYPSVDTTLQQVDDALVSAIKERYGLASKKCILTLGRLVERKGHDIVLQALPDVIKSVPQVHYLIVGKGANESRLRALVRELQLEPYVTFVGFVPDEELAAYYAACDIFVMISREIPEKGDIEGFGIVYLEANLMGKPVVAGRSGGVPEAVLHEETGLLVNPTDIQEVAAAIIRLLKDQGLANHLGETGRRRAATKFSSEASAKKVLAALSNTG